MLFEAYGGNMERKYLERFGSNFQEFGVKMGGEIERGVGREGGERGKGKRENSKRSNMGIGIRIGIGIGIEIGEENRLPHIPML